VDAVSVDGERLDGGSGADVPLLAAVDLGALAPGQHTLYLNATTASGSFERKAHVFHVTSNVLAQSGVESGDARWTFSGAAPGDRGERWGPANRTGLHGARVVATSSAGVPLATFTLPESVGAGRHWAFVRANGTPTTPLVALRLAGANGSIAAVRIEPNLTVSVDANGALAWTGLSVIAHSWLKVEVKDTGSAVSVYVDNRYAGTYARAPGDAVTRHEFSAVDSAGTGEMFVDDVAVTVGDALVRDVLAADLPGHPDAWYPDPAGTGLFETYQDPLKGSRALRVNATPSAPMSGVVDVPATVPDFSVLVTARAYERGCSGNGTVVKLVDETGAALAEVRCAANALTAWNGTAEVSLGKSLSTGAYASIRLAVASRATTIFVDDVFAAEVPTLAGGALRAVRVGGGDADLLFDEAFAWRGRTLLAESFEGRFSWRGWTFPPAGSATLNATVSDERPFNGAKSVKVVSSGLNEAGGATRGLAGMPPRFMVQARVYVPPYADTPGDGITALGILADGTLQAGFRIVSDAIGQKNKLELYSNVNGVTGYGDVNAGTWLEIGFLVDAINKTALPVVSGTVLPGVSYSAAANRVGVGDFQASGTLTGRGKLYLDALRFNATDVPARISITSVSGPVGGVYTFQGTTSDDDFGDAAEKIEMRVDGGPRVEIGNGARWTASWNAAGAAPGEHSIQFYATQGGQNTYVETTIVL
ncbi:MAG TPA: hypothetical protein VHH36_05625, partial [Candidatus Thermoplasmatota archaeon]|nr:hypothetical protein [Candidatus Thermoplasmatota archaeon]